MPTLKALDREAAKRGVRVVGESTLLKYGATRRLWLALLAEQGWVCAVCKKLPPSGRLVTDHEHVRGWVSMPPALRWQYVRGITCWPCNRYLLARGISIAVAESVAAYLRKYEARRPR